jgi:hypothetical protein
VRSLLQDLKAVLRPRKRVGPRLAVLRELHHLKAVLRHLAVLLRAVLPLLVLLRVGHLLVLLRAGLPKVRRRAKWMTS